MGTCCVTESGLQRNKKLYRRLYASTIHGVSRAEIVMGKVALVLPFINNPREELKEEEEEIRSCQRNTSSLLL